MTINSLIVTCLVACSSMTASARIGETLEQCKARYGNPFNESTNRCSFIKSDYMIIVDFFGEKADCIVIGRKPNSAKSKKLSDNEIQGILKANGSDKKWIVPEGFSIDRQWQTEDQSLIANYATFQDFLFIVTVDHHKRLQSEEIKKENQNLLGF